MTHKFKLLFTRHYTVFSGSTLVACLEQFKPWRRQRTPLEKELINGITIISIISCISIQSGIASAKDSCIPNVKTAIECPKNGSLLLDDGYPVAMATVSTFQGTQFAAQFVSKVMFSQQKTIPILVSAKPAEFDLLKTKLMNNPNFTARQKKEIQKNLIRVDPSQGDGENWQQDFYEAQFSRKTGLPVMREVANYISKREMRSDYTTDISKKLKPCGLNTSKPLKIDFDSKYMTSGMSGGNLESLPNGICLIGSDAFETAKHLKSYAKNVCGTDQYLETPSDFLTVGHTDEFMNVIQDPSQPPPCNYAITLASPRKALELLMKNPAAPLFNANMMASMTDEGDPGGEIREICVGIHTKKYYSAWAKKNKIHYHHEESGTGTTKNFLFKILNSSAWAESAGSKNTSQIEPSPEEEFRKRYEDIRSEIYKDPKRECGNLKNSDLLEYYSLPDFNAKLEKVISEIRLSNDAIQEKLDRFKDRIIDTTKKNTPSCHPEIIDVPFLFKAKFDKKTNTAKYGVSLFPNSTNGLRLGNRYIFPNLGNDTFGKYTIDQYVKHGMDVDSIDTFIAHSLHGNLHCSSHLLRYCNPR